MYFVFPKVPQHLPDFFRKHWIPTTYPPMPNARCLMPIYWRIPIDSKLSNLNCARFRFNHSFYCYRIMSFSQVDILKALSAVEDPDLKRDLVSLNMIKDVKVEPGKVSFTVVL